MDVSDVILKLQEHSHYLADWNNKVAGYVFRLFRQLLREEKHSSNGRLHLLSGRQDEFTLRLNPAIKRL